MGMFASSARPLTYVGAVFDEVTLRWDTDGDRMYDDDEAMLGTDPLSLDTDGDGFGDGEELLNMGSDPLVHMEGVDVRVPTEWKVAKSFAGDAWQSLLGEWNLGTDGEGESWLEAQSLNGALGLDLYLEKPAIRRFSFDVQHRFTRDSDAERTVDFHVYVDGSLVETHRLEMSEAARVYPFVTVLPHLSEGAHRIELVWENVFFTRTIAVGSAVLEKPKDLNGRETRLWGAHRVSHRSGVTADAAEVLSYVSPAQIEGYAEHIPLMEAAEFIHVRKGRRRTLGQNAVNRIFRHPEREHKRVGPTDKPWVRKDVPIRQAEAGHWYSEVALLADGTPRTLHYAFEGGGKVSTVRTQWLVTDALNTVDKTLKAGDALRISAGDEEDWDGSEVRLTVTTIDGVSEEHVFPDNLPLVIQFDSTSTVTVTYRGQTASFTITAVQPAAPQSTFIASQKGRERPFSYTAVDPGTYFSGGEHIVDSAYDHEAATADLRIYSSFDSPVVQKEQALVQRIEGDGRILATTPIEGFWVWENPTGFFTVIRDSAEVVRGLNRVYTSGLPPGVQLEIEVFRAGTMLENGSLSMGAAAFDPFGAFSFEIYKPADLAGSVCHQILIYQDGILMNKR